MKSARKNTVFSTSFMDIILGALGAFFLLLILVCVIKGWNDAKGEPGCDLPDNVLLFNVETPNFEFSKNLRFFAAIYNESDDNPFSSICFSHPFEDDVQASSKDSELRIKQTNGNAACYQMWFKNKEKDAPNALICVWLADWPLNGWSSDGSAKTLPNEEEISLELSWSDRDYGRGEPRRIKLKSDKGFAYTFFLTGPEANEDLQRKAINAFAYRDIDSSRPDWEKISENKIVPKMRLPGTAGSLLDKWTLCYKGNLGYFKEENLNSRNLTPNVFALESSPTEQDAFGLSVFNGVSEKVNNLGKAVPQSKISYASLGKRAICLRFEEEKQRLYVCPREDWNNASDFASEGILTSVENSQGWFEVDLSEEVGKFLAPHREADAELVLKYLADSIASPIYNTNSPITQASPLVSLVQAKESVTTKPTDSASLQSGG